MNKLRFWLLKGVVGDYTIIANAEFVDGKLAPLKTPAVVYGCQFIGTKKSWLRKLIDRIRGVDYAIMVK